MLDRRGLFRPAGGVAALGGVAWAGKVLHAGGDAAAADAPPDLYLAGTDGWIYLPPTPAIAPFHPDVLAPVTVHDLHLRLPQRHRADRRPEARPEEQGAALRAAVLGQAVRPDQPVDFRVQLTNLGPGRCGPTCSTRTPCTGTASATSSRSSTASRSGSVSVPSGRNFTYVYRPRDPGTYMYHCHVEDVEHVHMGMTGLVFVRPLQDGNTALYPSGKYLYNDGDGSTGFDREFAMFLSEVWAESHWADAHIQLPGVERLPGRLQPAQRTGLPGHARAERVDRPVQPGPGRQRRPDRTGRPSGAEVPAALVAGDAATPGSGWRCGSPTWASASRR